MLNIVLLAEFTYKAVFVGDVVGKFEFVEGHDFAHPLFAGGGRIRVDVHPFRHFRIRLSGDHPARVVELVSTVVNGDNVDEENVFGPFVQSRDLDLERRKHSPVVDNQTHGQSETTAKAKQKIGFENESDRKCKVVDFF